MAIEVSIAIERGRDAWELAELRSWLKPDEGQPWELISPQAVPDDSMGAGIVEICAIVSAAAQVPALVKQIRAWFPTRHSPPRVTITFTLDVTITFTLDPAEDETDRP